MITKITHITLFVHDQNDALNFYKKLGFQVHTDAQFGETRWLTVNLPEQKDVELVLAKAETEHEKNLVGKQGYKKPFISLETTDCIKEYDRLKKEGVTFLGEPVAEAWGIACGLEDLYGNMIYVTQTAQ